MLNKFFILLILLPASLVSAQEKNRATIVTGRVLSAADSNRVKNVFFAAIKEKGSGNIDSAEALFKKVLDTDPQNDAAMFELGNIYLAGNNVAEAEQQARRAVTVNPENKWYWMLLMDIYKKKNDPEQLLLVMDELIRIDPKERNYYLDKANVLSILGRPKEAEAIYTYIEGEFGKSAELERARRRTFLQNEDPKDAITRLQKAIKEHPDEVDHYLNLAEQLIKAKKPDQAISLLKRAQKKYPENAFVHLLLSDSYEVTGKKQEAFRELKGAFTSRQLPIDVKVQIILSLFNKLKEPSEQSRILTLASITTQTHPTEPKAHAVYGDVLYQIQNFDEAKKAYKKALSLNNNIYLIWAQLLQIELSQNDYREAIEDGEAALDVFQDKPDLFFFTAVAHAQNKNHETAVSYLNKAAELKPENPAFEAQIYSSLANSLNSLKKYQESDQAFERSLSLDPDNTFTLNNYAYYLALRKERLDKAAEMSRRSNELQPGNASFEDTFAWVLFTQNKFKEARVWIEKAIKNNPNSGVQYEHYGDILYKLGEKEAAVEQWVKARNKGVKSESLDKKINEKIYFE